MAPVELAKTLESFNLNAIWKKNLDPQYGKSWAKGINEAGGEGPLQVDKNTLCSVRVESKRDTKKIL